MKIVFESTHTRFNYPFRIIGNAGRYDTISDCEFLDASHIVCADRQMACIYLIQFDLERGTHTILDSATCVFNGVPLHFELISVYRDPSSAIPTIYSISYSNVLFSCRIVDNKFRDLRTVVVNPEDKYHGVLALQDRPSVYVTNMARPTITEFNTQTGAKRTLVCSGGVRMKDVAIIDADHIISISSDYGPINGVQKADGTVAPRNPPYDSHVLIYNRHSGALLCRYTLEKVQVDGCMYRAPFCYVTCTDISGAGYIWRGTVDSGYKFTDVVHIPCAGFPHGLDEHMGMFAYTSYSERALYIEKMEEFVKS